jgi:CRP-like cAMP-binding protein
MNKGNAFPQKAKLILRQYSSTSKSASKQRDGKGTSRDRGVALPPNASSLTIPNPATLRNLNTNMTNNISANANVAVTSLLQGSSPRLLLRSTSFISTRTYYRDKHGRRITRRVVRSKQSKSPNKKSKSSSFFKFPRLRLPSRVPKILVSQNIVPQPLPLLPGMKHLAKQLGVAPAKQAQGTLVAAETAAATQSANATAVNVNSKSVLMGGTASSSTTSAASAVTAAKLPHTATEAATAAISSLKSSSTIQQVNTMKTISTPQKFYSWLWKNWGVLVLNCGSLATLSAFTRTDILELRLLSITGSFSTIVYFLSRPPPRIYGPIGWSSIFVMTNAVMVYYIMEERKGKPRAWTEEEQEVYEEHFLSHGLTPRQFEKIVNIAKVKTLPRGEILIREGQHLQSVYLVTRGSTEAVTTLSRRVTAASSQRGNKNTLQGGDAGAWIGELSFLDSLGSSQVSKVSNKITKGSAGGEGAANGSVEKTKKRGMTQIVKQKIVTNAKVIKELTDLLKDENIGDDASSKTASAELASIVSESASPSNTVQKVNQGLPKRVSTSSMTGPPSSMDSSKKQQDAKVENDDPSTPAASKHALLTYIATEDSVLYEWDYDELITLLNSSAELKAAMMRAMTAAGTFFSGDLFIFPKLLSLYHVLFHC